MRGLRKSIKCMLCPHKKVCHEELDEVPRLRGIIEELKLENEEYERQVRVLQHEKILLQNEVNRLSYKETMTKVPVNVSPISKRNVKLVIDTYVKTVGCKTCVGCGYCHVEDEQSCSETIYKIFEKHFHQIFSQELKLKLNALYGKQAMGYTDTDNVNE